MLSGNLHAIHTIFDQYANVVKRATTLPGEQQRTILELEAKYGRYSEDGFNSTVPYVHYNRLLDRMRNNPDFVPEIVEESHVAQSGNIRRITVTNPGDVPETVTWQQKIRIRDFELHEYDVRVSANTEQTLSPDEIPQPFEPKVIRERTRHTFERKDGFVKIDMTEVMMRGADQIVRPRYEVELEFLGSKDELYIFEQEVDRVFKMLRGTNLTYTNTTKNELIRDVIKILGGARDNMIDKDVLVEARNIKRRDLVYGGIVGNQSIQDTKVLATPKRPEHMGNGTNYVVTFKADGLRKMLIIHRTGIWLVYPPFEFNLVLDLSLKVPQLDVLLNRFNGTIFDGELVQPKQPKPIDYWYLVFDCLAFRGNRGIQEQPYTARQQIVTAIAGVIKTPILTIDTKDTEEIKTPKDFFRLIRTFLDRRADLEYNEDGLIFIPIDTHYNPYSQRYPLKDRALTRIPDVCKWKEGADITIDFAIKQVQGGRLELYSYDDVAKQMVQFRGDMINPLTPEMIDHTDPLTLNKPANLVVEYEWIQVTPEAETEDTKGFRNPKGILKPRRIRYDKSGPNRLSIALDDWEDIMNPIKEEDIRGDTLLLSRLYGNRIKRALYRLITENPEFTPKTKTVNRFRGVNILDIGSGKGGDTASWTKLGDKADPATGFIVAVEPNENNRLELVSRIGTFGLQDKVVVVPTGGEDTIAITDAVRKHIPGGKVDAVTLMLSMSFFWASDAHLDALVATIATNLKPGGQIVFYTIDGDTVEQLFEPALGGPHVTNRKIVTADITLYPRPSPPFGRPVDFILPETIVGEQREYIVHLNDFTLRLAQYGIHLHEVNRAESEKLLSEENAIYSSMYSFGYYVNEDKTALLQYDQATRSLTNIVLPAIPVPTKYPAIQMNPDLPTPIITIVGTALPTTSPRLTVPTSPPRSPAPAMSPPRSPTIPSPAMAPTAPGTPKATVIVPTTPAIPQPTVTIPNLPTTPAIPQPTVTIPNLPTTPAIPQPTVIVPTTPAIVGPIIPAPGVPIVVPKLTKYQIEHNQLRWLAVSYTGRGGHIVDGPARNDDTYAPLNCTWYDNLVRIATIGDGSCFIHAVLKAFYREYQEHNAARYRLDLAARIRRDLAFALGLEDPQYPGHTYWETSARGSFPRMVMQQINDEDLVRQLRVDYSLAGLQRLFNSTSQLGDEVYSYVADALNIDIYVLRATQGDLYPHYHTRRPGINRNGIVIIGNMYHYEVLAVNTDQGFQTVFSPGDPFLEAMTEVFIGDGDFNDIVNTIPYDPDEAFINDFVDAFTTQAGLQVPKIVEEIFPETDPFRVQMNRLLPRIREVAEIRIIALTSPAAQRGEHPVLTRLDQILGLMEQQGLKAEDMNQIRQVVEHRLNPDVPQDLDHIIASAETDGLLTHDTVEAILNIEATL